MNMGEYVVVILSKRTATDRELLSLFLFSMVQIEDKFVHRELLVIRVRDVR
jgi:hypothetical protein